MVIACTANEIDVLKDRPFSPECHILGRVYSRQRIKAKSFELA